MRQRQILGAHPAFILGSVLLCPVVGRSRPAVVACCTVRSGVFHHWIHHLWPQGAVPPGFNPLRRGWVYRPAPEAPRKGECRRGPRHFWNCLSRWATGPTLKTALCHIRTLVGRRINTARSWRSSLRRNPAFCAVESTLTYGVGPTSRVRPAFLPPT